MEVFMPKKIDLIGKRFGRLVVLSEAMGRQHNKICWECVCECGNTSTVLGESLRRGKTTSCGCFKIENQTTHGKHCHELYLTWYGMIQRCDNDTHISYDNYGGRGVTVCERWYSFDNFISDMGERPMGFTLDRIDNDIGYSPSNCKWSNRIDQANNRRDNQIITYNGETLSHSQWSQRLFNDMYTVRQRLHLGWSIEDTLTIPKGSKHSKYKHITYNGETLTYTEWSIKLFGEKSKSLVSHRISKGMTEIEAITTPKRKR